MGTFSRIRYVVAANLNALIEKAEDPEKLLRALIREMEDAGEDARQAAADILAEEQHLERVCQRMDKEIGEWQERAEKAVETDRDDLARAALKAKAELVETRASAASEHEALSGRMTQLETDMTTLKAKLAEAKAKLKEMHTRDRVKTAAAPKAEEHLSRNERKIRQAMGRFDRLQNQVERLEARVRSYEVGDAAPSPWSEPEAPADPVIEDELSAIKSRLKGKETAPKPAEKVTKAETAGSDES